MPHPPSITALSRALFTSPATAQVDSLAPYAIAMRRAGVPDEHINDAIKLLLDGVCETLGIPELDASNPKMFLWALNHPQFAAEIQEHFEDALERQLKKDPDFLGSISQEPISETSEIPQVEHLTRH